MKYSEFRSTSHRSLKWVTYERWLGVDLLAKHLITDVLAHIIATWSSAIGFLNMYLEGHHWVLIVCWYHIVRGHWSCSPCSGNANHGEIIQARNSETRSNGGCSFQKLSTITTLLLLLIPSPWWRNSHLKSYNWWPCRIYATRLNEGGGKVFSWGESLVFHYSKGDY